ncbi:CLUMA_CG002663, isoform A [Clunio marinus]|uniref:CLUMA_CG002663, isoform A n=1 Tax=Clunio marinus TaxID=568069 RepID=A0A1J1HNI0_9DIPT|nr:CLUMA_CG002663, isoform A [Clunio marinus]
MRNLHDMPNKKIVYSSAMSGVSHLWITSRSGGREKKKNMRASGSGIIKCEQNRQRTTTKAICWIF